MNQWGASLITQDPIYYATPENPYISVSLSMANWGSHATPFVSNAPELYYYSQGSFNTSGYMDFPLITPSIQKYLFATDYSWYGFNNLWNNMMLMQDFVGYT